MRFVLPFLVSLCISPLRRKKVLCFTVLFPVHADRVKSWESYHHGKSVTFAFILHPKEDVIRIWSICSLNAVADKSWLLFGLNLCHVRIVLLRPFAAVSYLLCFAASCGSWSNKSWSCTVIDR